MVGSRVLYSSTIHDAAGEVGHGTAVRHVLAGCVASEPPDSWPRNVARTACRNPGTIGLPPNLKMIDSEYKPKNTKYRKL